MSMNMELMLYSFSGGYIPGNEERPSSLAVSLISFSTMSITLSSDSLCSDNSSLKLLLRR